MLSVSIRQMALAFLPISTLSPQFLLLPISYNMRPRFLRPRPRRSRRSRPPAPAWRRE